MSGRNGKRMRATFPERPVVLITSIGPEEEYRWKDSVTTGAEIQAWISDGFGHGMLPWFTKFNGVVPDKRWVAPVVETFSLHADLEPVLADMTPTAEIALLDPATTLRHYSPEERAGAEVDDLGFYHALIEARLPFELISDQVLTPESLTGSGGHPRQRQLPVGRTMRDVDRLCETRRQPRRRLRDRRPATKRDGRAALSASATCSASR